LEAIWAEVHDFLERQNSRPGIRSNLRSISPTLPITIFAIIISMGGWLWLLGGGVLELVYKVLIRRRLERFLLVAADKEYRLAFKAKASVVFPRFAQQTLLGRPRTATPLNVDSTVNLLQPR
jgi:hypothetical protein